MDEVFEEPIDGEDTCPCEEGDDDCLFSRIFLPQIIDSKIIKGDAVYIISAVSDSLQSSHKVCNKISAREI